MLRIHLQQISRKTHLLPHFGVKRFIRRDFSKFMDWFTGTKPGIDEAEIMPVYSSPSVARREYNRRRGVIETGDSGLEGYGRKHKKGKGVKKPEEVEDVPEHNPNDDLGYYYSPEGDTSGGNSRNKLVETVQIMANGGKGGNGCISNEVLAPGKKRPNGGNGGAGGSVYLLADIGLSTLSFQTFHFNAGDGAHGGSDGLTGKRGRDVYIRVPVGTTVSEKLPETVGFENYDWSENYYSDDYSEEWKKFKSADEGEAREEVPEEEEEEEEEEAAAAAAAEEEEDVEEEEEEAVTSFYMSRHGQTLCIAQGGDEGLGNKRLAGSRSGVRLGGKSGPRHSTPGQHGTSRTVVLQLQLIADVGLVGYPNAGKSTLLRCLSNARPKVAPYPFTTLRPYLGVVEYTDGNNVSVADIPGIIEGASENKGLGHSFLKHIERTKCLLYVIDGAGGTDAATRSSSPAAELTALRRELEMYDPELLLKPQMVFLNKGDIFSTLASTGGEGGDGHSPHAHAVRQREELLQLAEDLGIQVIQGSARNGDGAGELAYKLRLIANPQ